MKIVIYVLILGIFSVCPTLAMDVDDVSGKENHRAKFKNIRGFSFDALRDSLPTLPQTKKAKKGPLKRLVKSGGNKAKSKRKGPGVLGLTKKNRPVTPRHSSPIHSENGDESPFPSPSLSPIQEEP